MLEADICQPLASSVATALEGAQAGGFPGFYEVPSVDDPCPQYYRVSPKHLRSFAVADYEPTTDEFGHHYTSAQAKGTFFPESPRRRDIITCTTFEAFGLADYETLDTGILSYELRAAGLPTEDILYTARLQEGIIGGQVVPIDTYKEQLIEQCDLDDPGLKDRFVAWVEDVEFFGVARRTETAARLDDFDNRYPDHVNYTFLKEMVDFQNMIAGQYGEVAVEIDDPEAVARLLFEALPERIGQASAILHASGRAHFNLHSGNWKISGMFLDLDTVKPASEVSIAYEKGKLLHRIPRRIEHIGQIIAAFGAVDGVPERELIRSHLEAGMARVNEPLYPLL